MKTKKLVTRALALLFCFALLAGVSAPMASAALISLPTITWNGIIPKITWPSNPFLQQTMRLLAYRMDENGVFYVDHAGWQKQFGFNSLYDNATPFIQLVYATLRVKFDYDYVYQVDGNGDVVYVDGKAQYALDAEGKKIPKSWMIQGWKGRYGLVLLGGEIGVYVKPKAQAAEHYESAMPEEEVIMAIDVYQHSFKKDTTKYLFTRGPEPTWWVTGFVAGNFEDNVNNNHGKDEVIMVSNLEFNNKTLLDLYVKGLKNAGFVKGSPSKDNVEQYVTSGNSVKFSWQYYDEDK